MSALRKFGLVVASLFAGPLFWPRAIRELADLIGVDG